MCFHTVPKFAVRLYPGLTAKWRGPYQGLKGNSTPMTYGTSPPPLTLSAPGAVKGSQRRVFPYYYPSTPDTDLAFKWRRWHIGHLEGEWPLEAAIPCVLAL